MDVSYFGNQDPVSKIEYGVRWPEHDWAGETIPEHVQGPFLSLEGATQVAASGFNRDFSEVPGQGVVMFRHVEITAWAETEDEK